MSTIEAVFPRLVELRRTLHEYPELALKEERTAQVIIEELTRLGVDHEYEGLGSAVIGRLQSKGPGRPTIALRAEMDGLPANEHTGLPFASKIPGQMHACGHYSPHGHGARLRRPARK